MAAHHAQVDSLEQYGLLAAGISQAGAFLDGNKRTAFIAADVFLRANGGLFTGDPIERAQQLVMLEAREGGEGEAMVRSTRG